MKLWLSYGVTGGPSNCWFMGTVSVNIILVHWVVVDSMACGFMLGLTWYKRLPCEEKCHFYILTDWYLAFQAPRGCVSFVPVGVPVKRLQMVWFHKCQLASKGG